MVGSLPWLLELSLSVTQSVPSLKTFKLSNVSTIQTNMLKERILIFLLVSPQAWSRLVALLDLSLLEDLRSMEKRIAFTSQILSQYLAAS